MIDNIIAEAVGGPERETHTVSLRETFNIETEPFLTNNKPKLDENGNVVYKDKKIQAFTEPGPLTPSINPYYKFQAESLRMCLLGMELNNSIYFVGHSGTGKSEMVNQLAARLNYNVVQINFDGHLLRSDVMGEFRIKDGEMFFRHGLLPLGYTMPGTILLLDEVDAAAPETAFVMQRAISSDRRFLMHETNEMVHMHPQNVLMATANTAGGGDDTGLYLAGTNVQNFSFQNRWETVIELDYLEPKDELEVLKAIHKGSRLSPEQLMTLCSIAKSVRDAFKAGRLSVPLTTRDLIAWAAKLARFPYPMRTAEYTFLNRMPREDAMAVASMIQHSVKLSPKDSTKFVSNKNKGTRV